MLTLLNDSFERHMHATNSISDRLVRFEIRDRLCTEIDMSELLKVKVINLQVSRVGSNPIHSL